MAGMFRPRIRSMRSNDLFDRFSRFSPQGEFAMQCPSTIQDSMKRSIGCAALLFAVAFATEVMAQAAKDVTVANTPANPVPVVSQGVTAISGVVSLNGTPNVNVVNSSGSPLAVTAQGTTQVSGAVEITKLPTASVTYSVGGATQGHQTYEIADGPIHTSLLVLSSTSWVGVQFFGPAVALNVSVFPNQTVVIPLTERLPFDRIETDCADPDGVCEYFSINVVGTPG
jgi:hypothetical protein